MKYRIFNPNILLIVMTFSFLSAKLHTEYFHSGELKLKGEIISGERQGTWTWYNRSGNKWQEHVYDNGKLVSEMKWSIYKPKPEIEIPKSYNPTTKESLDTLSVGSNVPTEYTGTWIDHYDSGNLKAVIEYMQGLKHGKSTLYRENGKLERIERYISGQKNGKWTFYDENDNIIEDGIYLNNKKNGRWSTYYPNGKIIETGFYKFDNKTGAWKRMNEKGNVISIKDH